MGGKSRNSSSQARCSSRPENKRGLWVRTKSRGELETEIEKLYQKTQAKGRSFLNKGKLSSLVPSKQSVKGNLNFLSVQRERSHVSNSCVSHYDLTCTILN